MYIDLCSPCISYIDVYRCISYDPYLNSLNISSRRVWVVWVGQDPDGSEPLDGWFRAFAASDSAGSPPLPLVRLTDSLQSAWGGNLSDNYNQTFAGSYFASDSLSLNCRSILDRLSESFWTCFTVSHPFNTCWPLFEGPQKEDPFIVDFLVPPSVLYRDRSVKPSAAVFSRYHFEPTVFRAGFYTIEIYLLRPGGEEFVRSKSRHAVTTCHNMSQHATACHIIIAPAQCSHQKGATPVLVLPTKVQAEGVVLLNTDRIGQCAEKSFFFKVFEGSWLEREHNLI